MSVPADAWRSLLQKKVELLRQGTDYRLLLETVATLCSQTGPQMLPEDMLASVSDEILRTVARDISSLVRGSKVMLHIYVSSG